MAQYTAAELKVLTSVPAVAGWADVKILSFQQMAESTLTSLDLDTTVSGYADAYAGAVVILFDWFADNPTSLQSVGRGKVNKQFISDNLPPSVRALLQIFIEGTNGTLQGAAFERCDIGRR